MDVDNICLVQPPLAPPATTTKVTPSEIAETLAHTAFREGPRRAHLASMLDGCITDLEGDDFWRVLLQCFDCHYKLWLSGVHHRDVSAFNLMYKRREDEAIVGVLIDFDLAIPHGSQSTNTKRTGTMLFMALDMLENIIYNTNQVHLYQHDAESFLWLAMWVCGTYEDGEQRWNASFETWAQGDVKHCADSKYGFMARNEQDIWSKSHQARAGLLWKICSQLDDDAIDRRRQRRADGGVVQPEEPECPDTHYNRIDSKLFSTLRKELGE